MVCVDVVLPVYRNRDSLVSLYEAVSGELKAINVVPRFVLVDDACPERSTETIEAMNLVNVEIIKLPTNGGQQSAIRRGLAQCGDCPAIVMDADLQDPPEAIPKLLAELETGSCDAIFATKQGYYGPLIRTLTGRAFRTVVRFLVPLPVGAGGFVALSAATVQRLNDSTNPRFYLAGMVGCHAPKIGAIPISRHERPSGRSAYTSSMRWRTGFSNIRCIIFERKAYARQGRN